MVMRKSKSQVMKKGKQDPKIITPVLIGKRNSSLNSMKSNDKMNKSIKEKKVDVKSSKSKDKKDA